MRGNGAEMVAECRVTKGASGEVNWHKPCKKEQELTTAVNYKVDNSGVKEFGGVLGTLVAMIFSRSSCSIYGLANSITTHNYHGQIEESRSSALVKASRICH